MAWVSARVTVRLTRGEASASRIDSESGKYLSRGADAMYTGARSLPARASGESSPTSRSRRGGRPAKSSSKRSGFWLTRSRAALSAAGPSPSPRAATKARSRANGSSSTSRGG